MLISFFHLSNTPCRPACAFALALLLAGCQPPIGNSGLGKHGCKRCHNVKLDPNHAFKCTRCHRGQPEGYRMAKAHKGLVKHPASPENSSRFCAKCHPREDSSAKGSIHYSLEKEIGAVWLAFFPGDIPPSLSSITGIAHPKGKRAIVSDALARRCLRCHVYYQGDSYRCTHRGTGCAACHMDIEGHGHKIFKRPAEKNCLSCHYANFIGWDYEGRFEKDYPEDFRAPLYKGHHIPRPYGVEWLSMRQDIHKRAGLGCLNCHGIEPFHKEIGHNDTKDRGKQCTTCHVLDTRIVGHREQDIQRVNCGACHAIWSALDLGRNLLRQDDPDLEEWKFLKVQGSSEIEEILDEWADASEMVPEKAFTMTDKIDSTPYPGLWFAAFEQRRWAPVILGTDNQGRLSVIRPILDLSISYEDSDEVTVIDALRPARPTSPHSSLVQEIVYPATIQTRPLPAPYLWLPYHPHTIGKADYFRSRFVQGFLSSARGSSR